MRLTLTVQRFHPEQDQAPHPQEFRLDVARGSTVLDTLIRITHELDSTLSLRYSCRSSICGSCAMDINGSEKLACRTSVRQEYERHGRLAIGPLRHFPVIKDLVVDMAPFWSKIRHVTPWLYAARVPTRRYGLTAQRTIKPDEAQFHDVDACIMCGACVGACTVFEVSRGFLGPAALAKVDRFLSDPREPDESKRDRLSVLQGEHGIWDCTRCNFCVQVCPKDVKPMEAIIRLRRASLDWHLATSAGARHVTGFAELIESQGRLNEALMPLKVVGRDPRRLLHVFPLGVRMWLKGKVPNPFARRMTGWPAVRGVFQRLRRPLAVK